MSDYPDNNPKTVYGVKKPPLHLIPAPALLELAAVMRLGAEKYGAYNWREKTVSASVYIAAAQRHLLTWFDGESIDVESGASHLAHAMACLAIVLDGMAIGKLHDDRPPPAPTGELIRKTLAAQPNLKFKIGMTPGGADLIKEQPPKTGRPLTPQILEAKARRQCCPCPDACHCQIGQPPSCSTDHPFAKRGEPT